MDKIELIKENDLMYMVKVNDTILGYFEKDFDDKWFFSFISVENYMAGYSQLLRQLADKLDELNG